MTKTNRSFERAMVLAALSGLKVTFGPALLATSQRWPSRQNWLMAAMGEMVLDKLGILPSRSRLPSLLPRTLTGAWVAREVMREHGDDDPWVAVTGGMVAASVAIAAPMIRLATCKVLGVPDALVGLGEDYLALQLGTQILNVSMDEITGPAREMFDDVRERARPALQSIGIES